VLQVIGETGPQHFHVYLHQPSDAKLSQPQLAFDPRVAEFHDPSTTDHNLSDKRCVIRPSGEQQLASKEKMLLECWYSCAHG